MLCCNVLLKNNNVPFNCENAVIFQTVEGSVEWELGNYCFDGVNFPVLVEAKYMNKFQSS